MRAYDGIRAERGNEVNLDAPGFLEQARQLLANNIPLEIRLTGGTMRPSIQDGDMVTVEPINDETIQTGDIILYHSIRDTAVIHRVVRVEKSSAERRVVTRADAAVQMDIPVPLHRILGKVKRVRRAGESLKMTGPSSPRNRLQAWLKRLKFW
ncbi:MAG: signal peptidase I [Blastocatellia bacterium AA13]|nr:MAG: signal peptidase I [Blastocatellia bacterium AA13]